MLRVSPGRPSFSDAVRARPEQFIDSSFVRELDASGFIDRLYKSTRAIAVGSEHLAPARPTQVDNFSSDANTTGIDRLSPPEEKSKQAPVLPAGRTRSEETVSGEEYIINPGDTLSKVAERFYGARSHWVRIYQANKRTVKNPNFIYIGQRIIIPPV